MRNRPPRGLSVLRRVSAQGNLGLTLPLPMSLDLAPDVGTTYRPVRTPGAIVFLEYKEGKPAENDDHEAVRAALWAKATPPVQTR